MLKKKKAMGKMNSQNSQSEPVTAAGGVVHKYDKQSNSYRILLIFRHQKWDLPKGKHEKGETIEECALREVAEETGISEKIRIGERLPSTYHEYERDGIQYGKTTYWFEMMIEDEQALLSFEPQKEEGIIKIAWTLPTEAKEKIDYQNLHPVIDSLQEHLTT